MDMDDDYDETVTKLKNLNQFILVSKNQLMQL